MKPRNVRILLAVTTAVCLGQDMLDFIFA